MQAMIKTRVWETGVISEKKRQPLYDTLAAALGGILNAEKTDQCSSGLPGRVTSFLMTENGQVKLMSNI